MDLTPVVLRNKGVPIEVASLTYGDSGWAREYDGDDLVITEVWIRYTANEIADIEEAYGTLVGYEEALARTPFGAVRRSLAIALGVEPTVAGLRMLEGKIDAYATAVSCALAIANGVDPTEVARLYKAGVVAAGEMEEAKTALVRETLNAHDLEQSASPGESGSDTGPEPSETLSSSGA